MSRSVAPSQSFSVASSPPDRKSAPSVEKAAARTSPVWSRWGTISILARCWAPAAVDSVMTTGSSANPSASPRHIKAESLFTSDTPPCAQNSLNQRRALPEPSCQGGRGRLCGYHTNDTARNGRRREHVSPTQPLCHTNCQAMWQCRPRSCRTLRAAGPHSAFARGLCGVRPDGTQVRLSIPLRTGGAPTEPYVWPLSQCLTQRALSAVTGMGTPPADPKKSHDLRLGYIGRAT